MNFSDTLQSLSLTDVEPLDHELGCGSYGRFLKLDISGGMICAAKEIHALLIELSGPEARRS